MNHYELNLDMFREFFINYAEDIVKGINAHGNVTPSTFFTRPFTEEEILSFVNSLKSILRTYTVSA